jgi:hypothetical protein
MKKQRLETPNGLVQSLWSRSSLLQVRIKTSLVVDLQSRSNNPASSNAKYKNAQFVFSSSS